MQKNRFFILKLYGRLLPAQLLNFIANAFINLFGGIIIGKVLGQQYLAAFGVASTLPSIAAMTGSGFAAGAVLFSGKSVCKRNREQTERVFSESVLFSFIAGVFLLLLCWLFPRPIAAILGASPDIMDLTVESLYGLSFSLPAICLIPVLTYFLQLLGKSKTPILLSLLMMLLYAVLLPISIVIGRDTMFLSSLTVALAALACIVPMFIIYCRQSQSYRIQLKLLNRSDSGKFLIFAIMQSISSYLTIIKRIAFNVVSGRIGGVSALAIFSLTNNVSACLLDLFVPAAVNVTLMIVTIYLAEGDRDSMKHFLRDSVAVFAAIGVMFIVLLAPFAVPIAKLFGPDDVSEAAFALVMLAFAGLPFSLSNLWLTMCCAQKRVRDCTIISIIEQILFGIGSMFALSFFFGTKGMWISWVVAEVINVLFAYFYSSVFQHKPPKSLLELFGVSKSFGLHVKRSFHAEITDAKQISGISQQIIDAFTANGISHSDAMKCGLCVEEIAANIAEHGFTKDQKSHLIDVSAVQESQELRLIIRDDCVPFDPRKRFVHLDPEDPCRGIGIRMIMSLAKKVQYKSIYAMNVLTVQLDTKKDPD